MKDIKFVNAQEMNRLNPITFEVSSQKELNEIKEGDSVKISTWLENEDSINEKFWVNVVSVDGDKIKGIVDNNLILTHEHGLSFEDEVEFEKKNICSIHKNFKHVIEVSLDEIELEKEDGGQFSGFTVSNNSDEDNGMFVRICSWDEKEKHKEFNQFINRKVKITIETID